MTGAGIRRALLVIGGLSMAVALGAVVWLMPAIAALGDAARTFAETADGAELDTPEGLLDWMADHPDRVSLVVRTLDDAGDLDPEGARLEHHPLAARPVASMGKIAVALAWDEAVDAGRLDPSATVDLDAWERTWLPGTDGGAHDAALSALEGEPRWSDVAHAMIRFSDNAATDLLTRTLGPEALHHAAAPHGLDHADSIRQLGGTFVAWHNHERPLDGPTRARLLDLDPAQWEATRERWAARLLDDDTFREDEHAWRGSMRSLFGVSDQLALTRCCSPRGAADGFARAMAAVATGEHPYAAELLDWPMDVGDNADRFERFLAKGGALPGVISDAMAVREPGGPTRVVVLILEDVPFAGWVALLQSFAHQRLLVELATDPEAVTRARTALSRGQASERRNSPATQTQAE